MKFDLEVGTYKSTTHYAVIGRTTDFYIWIREPGERGSHSKWIVGKEAFELYHRFKGLAKDKEKFIELARATHKKHS